MGVLIFDVEGGRGHHVGDDDFLALVWPIIPRHASSSHGHFGGGGGWVVV